LLSHGGTFCGSWLYAAGSLGCLLALGIEGKITVSPLRAHEYRTRGWGKNGGADRH
jgi:hypothetical protein